MRVREGIAKKITKIKICDTIYSTSQIVPDMLGCVLRFFANELYIKINERL